MKRFVIALTLVLVLISPGLSQAQVTINSLDRVVGCEAHFVQDPTYMGWGDSFHDPGPYFVDLDVDEGDQHMRSVQDTYVTLDGSHLTVTGSFLGTVSTDDPAAIHNLYASANLLVSFTVSEPSTVSLEASVPGSGEVYFFDLTDNDYDFDNQGPGVFTLDDTLVPGHDYLFQVFYSAWVISGGPQQSEESVTLSMIVAPEPVAAGEVTWGAMKALFR